MKVGLIIFPLATRLHPWSVLPGQKQAATAPFLPRLRAAEVRHLNTQNCEVGDVEVDEDGGLGAFLVGQWANFHWSTGNEGADLAKKLVEKNDLDLVPINTGKERPRQNWLACGCL